MAEILNFKVWDDKNVFTNSFKMTTKYTDLGSADGGKSIIGVMLNIALEKESSASAPSTYAIDILYRTSLNNNFQSLVSFSNYYEDGIVNLGAVEITKNLQPPLRNIKNIQLQISSVNIRNDLGINDIGLIFRTYRSISKVNLNEE